MCTIRQTYTHTHYAITTKKNRYVERVRRPDRSIKNATNLWCIYVRANNWPLLAGDGTARAGLGPGQMVTAKVRARARHFGVCVPVVVRRRTRANRINRNAVYALRVRWCTKAEPIGFSGAISSH